MRTQKLKWATWCGFGLLAVVTFGTIMNPVFARPQYMLLFDQDPYSIPAWHGQCSTCHNNPSGGGERNVFGQAFEKGLHKITVELRASFPDRFLSEPRSSHRPSVQFDPRNPNLVVVEVNGEKIQIDTARKSFQTAGPPSSAAPSTSPVPPSPGVAPREKAAPVVLDHYFVNLPSAVPYARHSLNLQFSHRFSSPPFDETKGGGPSNLFGFDSFSISSFGVTYGITDRIAVRAYRSPLFKTIELGGEISILRESEGDPFSLKAYGSVEGRNNFKLTVANREFFEHFYGGNFQIVVSRSLWNRLELAFVPTFSGHTRFLFDPTTTRNNTVALGMAGSLKLTSRSALVAEYIPRVAGYVPAGTQPTVSFGIQRATQRHVFSLVVSKTQATTTGQQILGGNILTVGFNIYRRIL
ncbi:MAG: DUF5777 family beta-barrel protein [Acidobacteriia bacterium]|nr:DUF5777 family beta-barrel protein [Terriglobia bacterium]